MIRAMALGSSGLRVPYTYVRVVSLNEGAVNGRLSGPNEIGMLQVKGPGLAHGYIDPTHAAGARTADGWLVTGDLGWVDADGYVFVTGRAKDVIIRGGHNIDPALIEEPLLKLPEVLHAAAVGKPDAYAGELPVAYVQLAPGARSTASELIAAVAGRIAERAAIPKEIIIVDKLPLTDIGKPMKPALRRDIAERTFQSVLQAATKLPAGMLQLSVAAHPMKGDQLTIRIGNFPLEARGELTARIEEAMRPFAYPYDIAGFQLRVAAAGARESYRTCQQKTAKKPELRRAPQTRRRMLLRVSSIARAWQHFPKTHDPHAVLRAGHRVEDWFAAAFGHPRHHQASLRPATSTWKSIGAKIGSCSFSNVEANTLKTVAPGSVSRPVRCAAAPRAAARLPARRSPPPLHPYPRESHPPAENSHELQAIKLGRSVKALLDLEPTHGLTIAVRRQSIELAGAPVGAVAVDELTSLDSPFGVRHGRLPTGTLSEAEYPLSP